MIEVGFAIVLGFAIASTLCGLVADHSRADRIMIRALLYMIILSFLLGLYRGETTRFLAHAQILTIMSFVVHYLWLMLGAALAIVGLLITEGHAHKLWVRFHPQSAPSAEVGFGQRARPVGFKRPVAATLMGTSTDINAVSYRGWFKTRDWTASKSVS